MPDNAITQTKKRGRPEKSPNHLQEELQKKKQRLEKKRKGSRGWTEVRKRQADKLKRMRQKILQRRRLQEHLGVTVRKRLKAVRYYHHWHERFQEQEAALRAAQKHKVSPSTIRRWDRCYQEQGLAGLLPRKPGPTHAPYAISLEIQWLVVALRRLLGWNEKRMAEELGKRNLAHISHTAVGQIYKRYYLPTRTYHPKARCDGIAKGRYEKERPNQQWHIDFAETKLQDGTSLWWVVLIDDYSRYCLRCQVVPGLTAEVAIQTVQSAWQELGLPDEIVSDNGSSFTSSHPDCPTAFGRLLEQKGVRHCLITPFYPEGNGKAEAFVKIVKHECLNRSFVTLQELELALAEFVIYYNHFRLYGAIGYQTPVSRFLAVESPKNHGLAGIPCLPSDLVSAFPPSQPVLMHPVNLFTVKGRFALLKI